MEGVLLCPERLCRREHPIVDGIPVLVVDLVSWAAHQLPAVLRRDDLSPFTESLLGDAAGPGSAHDRERSNLSGYGRGHWGDLDPDDPLPAEASFAALGDTALGLLDAPPRGVWLDAGGAVGPGPPELPPPTGQPPPGGRWPDGGGAAGRGTLGLARRTGQPTAGVDLSFAMLRVAERVRRTGVAAFPQRRVGIAYDARALPVPDVPGEHLGFWCADVDALPFAAGTFAGALSLNVLDCVRSPLGHLLELGRVLAPGAPALLTTPYDWSVAATPVEGWIGGHSQRGEAQGSSADELRRILSADAAAGVDTGLVIADERDGVPWQVYGNERSSTEYSLHLMRLQRR